MRNTYKLLWSNEALNGLKEIVSYLENRFSQKDVKKFAIKFDKQLSLIKKNPSLFPYSTKSKIVRRSIVSKLTSIYFTVHENTIYLVTICDNRKNSEL